MLLFLPAQRSWWISLAKKMTKHFTAENSILPHLFVPDLRTVANEEEGSRLYQYSYSSCFDVLHVFWSTFLDRPMVDFPA